MHVTMWGAVSRNKARDAANQQAIFPALILRVNLRLMPSAAHTAYVLTQPHRDIWQMSEDCQTEAFLESKKLN